MTGWCDAEDTKRSYCYHPQVNYFLITECPKVFPINFPKLILFINSKFIKSLEINEIKRKRSLSHYRNLHTNKSTALNNKSYTTMNSLTNCCVVLFCLYFLHTLNETEDGMDNNPFPSDLPAISACAARNLH